MYSKKTWMIVIAAAAMALTAHAVAAMHPDDELWIPAAARGTGHAGSFWMTDLEILNLGDDAVTLELSWLNRGMDNTDADPVEVDIDGGETLVLDDVILSVFNLESATGAIRIEVADDEDETRVKADGDDAEIVASARIYTVDGDATFGQGFEGLVSDAAISSNDDDPTHAIGVVDDESFRSNWYGLNLTMDDDDVAEPAEVMVELLDAAGGVLASATYTMPPLAPLLHPVSDLGAGDIAHATLRFTMIEGDGLFGASKIDGVSNDPTTLEAYWDCGGDDDVEFTEEFFLDDCTFATIGRNPFWIPLEVGYSLRLEGDDDGELVSVTITVLDETFTVDGVETRVVEEYETIDEELAEISRNYFAICQETGSVFYFGEHVDIYEDGEVVSHDGEWLAGENGNRAGIIMPGTVLLGSRYFQEVAPEIAMDRAEHVAMGASIETPVGTFEECLRVDETTPLEPGDLSIKYYAPGVGLIIDDVTEVVEIVDPTQ